jgi:hypothetical protein
MTEKLQQMKTELESTTPNNYTGYVGVPAPEVLEYDEWFGHPPETERSIELRKAKELQQHHEEIYAVTKKPEVFVEPDNIHQLMYEMATENVATTLSLNPMLDLSIGGSENFHSLGGSENLQGT